MEKRLKKQRRRLFIRIVLILFAVWLVVSLLYCTVRISSEKSIIRNREIENISYAKQILTVGNGSIEAVNSVLLNNTDLMYSDSKTKKQYNSQYIITDRETQSEFVNTARTIGLRFSVKTSPDEASDIAGLIKYDDIRSALSDSEYHEIETLLNTEEDSRDYYELVCTKLQFNSIMFIPIELRIVFVNGSDKRFLKNDSVAKYDLSKNRQDGYEVFESSPIKRNVVPKNFILGSFFNEDFISSLKNERIDRSIEMIQTKGVDYIFYANDYIVYFEDEYTMQAENYFSVQYAKKINILDGCKNDLIIGAALIFGFFLTVGVLLCLMIWRTIEEQIIQEQKRLFMTNALAHDIKTPLFVISGYAYSLKENIDETEKDDYLDRIIEQTEEVDALVHKMLSFSRLDSYELDVNRVRFDLYELTQEVTKALHSLPEGRTIVIAKCGDNSIIADRELIKTALQNLIDNSVKHSLPNSEIQINITENTLSIVNQSEYIQKHELKQLWQPYYSRDKSRHNKGNGLGLSIVKSILDLHEAKYEIEIVEQVSGMNYVDYVRENFWQPLNMTHTGSLEELPSSPEWAHGCTYEGLDKQPGLTKGCGDMISNAADITIWLTSLKNGDIISKESFEAMTTDYSDGKQYGYAFRPVISGGAAHAGENGIYTAFDYINTDKQFTLFLASNSETSTKTGNLFMDILNLLIE